MLGRHNLPGSSGLSCPVTSRVVPQSTPSEETRVTSGPGRQDLPRSSDLSPTPRHSQVGVCPTVPSSGKFGPKTFLCRLSSPFPTTPGTPPPHPMGTRPGSEHRSRRGRLPTSDSPSVGSLATSSFDQCKSRPTECPRPDFLYTDPHGVFYRVTIPSK